jgi:NAD-dependent SIR2 family protein deacetylase
MGIKNAFEEVPKCPYCESEMKKGFVEISGSMPFSTNVAWYPEEERKKIFHDNIIWLKTRAEGYHCDNCDKIIAVFDKKERFL